MTSLLRGSVSERRQLSGRLWKRLSAAQSHTQASLFLPLPSVVVPKALNSTLNPWGAPFRVQGSSRFHGAPLPGALGVASRVWQTSCLG